MIDWNTFCLNNPNTRVAFEDMCRMLFRHKYLSSDTVLQMSPNNPGVEVEPVWNQERTHRISFQSKFFDNRPSYKQIADSVEEIIAHYSGKIDCVYLYCNKKLTLSAPTYVKAKKKLRDNGIELLPVCDDEILDQVREDQIVEHMYFGGIQISSSWISERLEISLAGLGERYNHEFNIETRTQRRFDLFLCNEATIEILNQMKSDVVKALEQYANAYGEDRQLARFLLRSVSTLQDAIGDPLSVAANWYTTVIHECADEIETAKKKIIRLKEKAEELEGGEKNQALYDLSRLERVLETIDGLQIDPIEKQLIEAKVLLVAGNFGTGKSHLLAEAATRCVGLSYAVILLLGSSLITNDTIGKQIVNSLDLDCSFDSLLDKLEGMAENRNGYSYLFVDALNECGNRKEWMNNVPQLLHKISRYKRIKLVISLRTGYERLFFGDKLEVFVKQGTVARLHHNGFWNDSIKAIQEFMNHYQIPFLPSYILSKEMTNPLFLKMFCKFYTGETVDIDNLFDKLIEKSDLEVRGAIGKETAASFLGKFIDEFVELRINKGALSITHGDLLDMKFWQRYGLENDKLTIISSLIHTGLLVAHVSNDEEKFAFSYQKMDDMFSARFIIKKYPEKEALIDCIVYKLLGIEKGKITHYSDVDIAIEACALYAKKNKEELFDEIVAHITDVEDQNTLVSQYLHSFSWRTHMNLTSEYFVRFLKQYRPTCYDVLDVLIENSTKDRHPLNAETLHRLLVEKKIAERDYLWTAYINNRGGKDDRLYQLLDYFECGSVFDHLTENTVKQFLIMNVWLFTASNRKLRDKATKVSVELLKHNLKLCKDLLIKFSDVDDPYVIERLYCAIYGACLKKTYTEKGVFTELALYVYEHFFLQETVYPDVLVRDYARLIIERWIFENPQECNAVDVSRIRPPYKSEPLPIVEHQTYYDSETFHSGMMLIDHSMRVNAGEHSHMYGDFGRYTFQSALEYFEGVDIVNCYHYAMQYIRDTLGYNDETLGKVDCWNRDGVLAKQRIGKKYQWIAFHHILSRIADHSILKHYGEEDQYSGPWKPYVRDLDPGSNQKIKRSFELPEFQSFEVALSEYVLEKNASHHEIEKWCETRAEIHKTVAERTVLVDGAKNEWVVLLRYEAHEYEPTADTNSGIYHANGAQKMWAHTLGHFVRKNEDFLERLKQMLVEGKDLSLTNGPDVYQLFGREYPWAPGVADLLSECWSDYYVQAETYREVETDSKLLRVLMKYKALGDVTEDAEDTETFTIPSSYRQYDEIKIGSYLPSYLRVLEGERQDASSADNKSYNIPCIELLQQAKLEQREIDGVFFTAGGEIAAFDPSICGGFEGLVVRKDVLDRFLAENQYELIWYICGEKQYFHGNMKQTWSTLRGLLHLTSDGVVGEWDYVSINGSGHGIQ